MKKLALNPTTVADVYKIGNRYEFLWIDENKRFNRVTINKIDGTKNAEFWVSNTWIDYSYFKTIIDYFRNKCPAIKNIIWKQTIHIGEKAETLLGFKPSIDLNKDWVLRNPKVELMISPTHMILRLEKRKHGK